MTEKESSLRILDVMGKEKDAHLRNCPLNTDK
jgi:hypothetical protein